MTEQELRELMVQYRFNQITGNEFVSVLLKAVEGARLTPEQIEKAHHDCTYDHENITCAGTLERFIANAQLEAVKKILGKV